MKYQFLALSAFLIFGSQTVNAKITEAVDLVVGEGYSVRCHNCRDYPVICAPASSSLASENLLRARNEINRVTVVFEGQSKQVGDALIRCGAQAVKDIELYVEYGCSQSKPIYQRDLFSRHLMPISPGEITDGQMNSEFEAKLSAFCTATGRELFFSGLEGIPRKVTVRGQRKKPKSVVTFE